ncbi:MAG TPA: hypothetical protein VL354_01210 [Spirochaetia bacterium]|nr:hypothetical protein [Spirochaetia bacterium]
MSRRAVLVLLACILVAGFPSGAFAQDHQPQPYSPDEFQGWMKDLWRAEVILVGSFPITLFLTLESYDLYRYFNTGFNATYAPWPFNTGSALNLTAQDQTFIIITAVGLSLTVAVIDFMIGRWNATSKNP